MRREQQHFSFLGDDQTPVKLLHQALIEDPYKPVIYLRLAEAYFNLGMYDKMYHWLETAMKIDNDRPTIMDNILETKVLASELLLKYYFNANRNTRKAYKASKELYKLNPTENNAKNVTYLEDLANMDIACEHLDKFWQYLESIGEEKAVLGTLQSLPQAIAKLPFVKKRHQKYGSPRVWQANEICYFANFGNAHFEKWDPSNLESGIGGSETAVIRLSQEWTKMGYKVTVYGDPHKVGYHDGVRYLPWYEFNAKDKFNIFIQWRNGGLANKISAKKFYVDLHDIYHQNDLIKIKDSIDQIMVKSKYHRDIAPDISNMKIVSNGI